MATQSWGAYMEGKRGSALVENSTHGNKIIPATSVKKKKKVCGSHQWFGHPDGEPWGNSEWKEGMPAI